MKFLGNDISHKLLIRMVERLANQYRTSDSNELEIKARCRMEVAAFMGFSTWEDILESMPPKPLKALKFSHSQGAFNHKTIVRLMKLARRCHASIVTISKKNAIQVKRRGSGSGWDIVVSRAITDQDVSSLIKHLWGYDASLLGRGTYWVACKDKTLGDYQNLRCKVEVDENSAAVVSIYLSEPSNRNRDLVGTIPAKTILHQQGMVIVSHSYHWEETILAICSRRQKEMSSSLDNLIHLPKNEQIRWPVDPTSLMSDATLRVFSVYNVYKNGDMRKTIESPPHIIALKPWTEEEELANAMEAQKRGCPVYLGVSGDDVRFTHKMERVADALLNIFEGLPEQSWKEKAQELVENLHSVVAVCDSHNYVQSVETMLLTPSLRTELICQIGAVAKPYDLYAFVARMVVAAGTSISSNAMIQEEAGIIEKDDRDWLLAVDEEWRQQWA